VEAALGEDELALALIDPAVAAAQGRLAEAREKLRLGDAEGAKRALALADPKQPGWARLRQAVVRALGGGEQRGRARDEEPKPGRIGVLGWHPRGGIVSPLQAEAVPGKGELHTTGNVGGTGLDAARVAASALKARASSLGISQHIRELDLHFHYADTELSKQGLSSGLGLVLAGLSAYLQKPLPSRLAATGEIALDGEVKSVAGIHEKLVAAALAGVKTVLLPRRNLQHVRALQAEVPRRVQIVPVDTIAEAAAAAWES
jgi:ATP-dependent Lon protease